MKLTTLLKLEFPLVSTALFVAGIVISTGAMFEYYGDPGKITIPQVGMTVGLTFLLGLISIHLTAKSIKQAVVYLERKKVAQQEEESVVATNEQLEPEPLMQILEQESNRSRRVINELARQLEAGQAALYIASENNLEVSEGYALSNDDVKRYACHLGEGLVGRVASAGQSLYIDNLPERYITVHSGLGSASPTFLAIIPLVADHETKGVLELALFKPLTQATILQLENIGKAWAKAGL